MNFGNTDDNCNEKSCSNGRSETVRSLEHVIVETFPKEQLTLETQTTQYSVHQQRYECTFQKKQKHIEHSWTTHIPESPQLCRNHLEPTLLKADACGIHSKAAGVMNGQL